MKVTKKQFICSVRLYGYCLTKDLFVDFMKGKVKTSSVWSYEIIAPKRGNTTVYRCPDAYVMRSVCEQVAKTMLLAFPSCEYQLIKIIHTEVLK